MGTGKLAVNKEVVRLAGGRPSGCPLKGFDAADARLWPMATHRRAACAVPEPRRESGEYRR